MSPRRRSNHSFYRRVVDAPIWRKVAAVVGFAGVVTGIVVAILGVLPHSTSCEGLGASLGHPSVWQTTWGAYKQRFEEPGNVSAAGGATDPSTPITAILVDASVDGQKSKPITLRWSMVPADGRTTAGLPQYLDALEFTPQRCEHTRQVHFVLNPPIPSGRIVRVRVFLVDEEGNELSNLLLKQKVHAATV